MALLQTIVDNPWKIIFGSSGTVIACVGALFAVDARYAHAIDVEKTTIEIRSQIQKSIFYTRKQNLEDMIFELDLKKSQNRNQTLSPVDQALSGRYQQQLNDLSSQIGK